MAQVVIEMTSDEAKLYRGMQRIKAQQDQMDASLKKTGATSRKTGKSMEGAFGSKAIGDLKGYMTGLVSVTAAITAAQRAFAAYQQMVEQAANRQRESRMGMSSLAQLADTPKQYRALVTTAKQVYRQGGADTLDAAGRLVFSLESAGALSHVDLFSQLRAKGLVEEPDVMARAGKTMIASMGQRETGSFEAIVSKAFAASKFSPASAEALLEATSRGGGSARALGMDDESILAATAMTATATGSAEMGGNQVNSLLRSLDRSGLFKGKSLRQSVLEISGMGLEGSELQKFFGRQEAVQAYRTILANMSTYDQAMVEIRKAESENLVRQKLALPETMSDTAAPGAVMASQNALNLAEIEKYGSARNIRNALLADRDRLAMEAGKGWFNRWAFGVSSWLNTTEEFIDYIEPYASPQTKQAIALAREEGVVGPDRISDPVHNETAKAWREAAAEMRSASAELRSASENMKASRGKRLNTHTE